MEAFEIETRIAEGEQALQALLTFAREKAGTLEVHEAEKGLFKRLLPIGLAAMKLYFAQRGTGEMGPAITRADSVVLSREKALSTYNGHAQVMRSRRLCTSLARGCRPTELHR